AVVGTVAAVVGTVAAVVGTVAAVVGTVAAVVGTVALARNRHGVDVVVASAAAAAAAATRGGLCWHHDHDSCCCFVDGVTLGSPSSQRKHGRKMSAMRRHLAPSLLVLWSLAREPVV
ncbi:unnamed protein product, partial [Ectocarpus fasciculatus]